MHLIKISIVLLVFFVGIVGTPLYGQTAPKKSVTTSTKEIVKSVELAVSGMTCQMGCADGIDRKLKKVAGIISSKTLLETGICKVTYDESKININQIIDVIKDRGYEAKVDTSKS